MIVRHASLFREMSAFYTDSETGAPLFNDRGELADDNDMHHALTRPDMEWDMDRLILEICSDERRKGKKLTHLWLQAELKAFMRTRNKEGE